MDGTVKDLITFCEDNKLMDVKMQTSWRECLSWSIFLDEEHDVEIEYNWYYDDRRTEIKKIVWYHNDDCDFDSTEISTEEALKLRGLE